MKNIIIALTIFAVVMGFYYKSNRNIETPKTPEANQWSPAENKITLKEPILQEKYVPKEIKTYADAIEASQKLNKPIFIYFGAEWCGYCVKMKKNTLSNKTVKDKLNGFIVLIVDADKNPELVKKFNVEGFPEYLIISSDEKILRKDSGYKDPIDFINWLKTRPTTKHLTRFIF